MKTLIIILIIALIINLAFDLKIFAKERKAKGSGGWGVGSEYQKLFNPRDARTFSGDVLKTDKCIPLAGMAAGVRIRIKTTAEEIDVHCGPEFFIERQDHFISVNEKVEIKGVRVTIQDQPILIASEIRRGTEFLKLRDENGIPVWSGWKKR